MCWIRWSDSYPSTSFYDLLTSINLLNFSMSSTKYTLYHSHFSLPSIIARFLVAMRGSSANGVDHTFEGHVINIFAGEQLSALLREGGDVMEEVERPTSVEASSMLTEQIPALCCDSPKRVISGPLDIGQHLSETFSSLVPRHEAERIIRWITDVNQLDWFSLSLPVPRTAKGDEAERSSWQNGFQEKVKQRLEVDTSAWYHAALMYRLRK